MSKEVGAGGRFDIFLDSVNATISQSTTSNHLIQIYSEVLLWLHL